MIYIELDLDDELHEGIQVLAEEEGTTVEDLIVETLRNEFLVPKDAVEVIEDEDEPVGMCLDDNEAGDEG
jgi:hypothetical protein